MTPLNYDIESSCGGKRRGCCIIELPHDAEPTDVAAHSCTQRILLVVSGLSIGGSPIGAVVSLPNPEAANELGKAVG
jgi:hypothetical protein